MTNPTKLTTTVLSTKHIEVGPLRVKSADPALAQRVADWIASEGNFAERLGAAGFTLSVQGEEEGTVAVQQEHGGHWWSLCAPRDNDPKSVETDPKYA